MPQPNDYGLNYNQYFRDMCDSRIIHAKGTIIRIKDDYINRQKQDNVYIGKYYMFSHKDNDNRYVFLNITYPYKEKKLIRKYYNSQEEYEVSKKNEYYLRLEYKDLNKVINEFIEDKRYETDEIMFTTQIKDRNIPKLKVLWILFIIILVASTICRDYWMLWIIEFILFNKIRTDIRKEFNEENKL